MKNIFFALLIFVTACSNPGTEKSLTDSVNNTDTKKSGDFATLAFEKNTYDFGLIKQGEKVSYSYKFKNTGSVPLIISDAQASCGCTVPDYPHEPVAPGKAGEIKVVFDSAGKSGKQNKAITITSNSNPSNTVIYLTGEVKEPATN